MIRTKLAVVPVALSMMVFAVHVSAAPGPAGVAPWDSNGPALPSDRPVGNTANRGTASVQNAADHTITFQCADGGWGWPHAACPTTTYHNITAPIATALLDAYAVTGDAAHLSAAVTAGNFDLLSTYGTGEVRFGAMTAPFMRRLSQVTGDMQYETFAATEFYGALAAGTYGPGPVDTAGWIASVQANRVGVWINLRPWEFSTQIDTATAIGVAGQDALFLQGVLDGLNTLDATDPFAAYYDLLGLAGAVRGLALSNTLTFPAIVSPNFAAINGINNLADLANVLASYQNGDGSWYWASNLAAPAVGDEDTQVTAYSILALSAANPIVPADFGPAITAGQNWLWTMQQVGGGFLSYPGGTENIEAEAEALSAALAPGTPIVTVPAASEWGLLVLTLIGMSFGTIMFSRRNAATA